MVRIATFVIALAVVPAALAKPASEPRIPLPDGWQPEGIAAGPGKSLYVGSIPTGAILKLNPKTGKTTTVVPARDEHAAIGVESDGKRLIAAGGPTGKIFAYDRKSGEELAALDVQGTFVNDIAKAKGGYYVTDSQEPSLYRVTKDLKTVTLPVNVPYEEGNNLNGIVDSPKGQLIAVQSNTGKLWRLNRKTGSATEIDLGGETLVNGDGLLRNGRTLLVVQNRDNKIAVVKLAKDERSAKVKRTITSSDFDVPTTLAQQGKRLYAVNARFGTTDEQPAPYWVTRVR